eukprot:2726278-Karenia_brevis.AAC.1
MQANVSIRHEVSEFAKDNSCKLYWDMYPWLAKDEASDPFEFNPWKEIAFTPAQYMAKAPIELIQRHGVFAPPGFQQKMHPKTYKERMENQDE